MKITVCGSLQFGEEMKKSQKELEKLGHKVFMPKSLEENQEKSHWNNLKKENIEEFTQIYGERMKIHFNKIKNSEAIVIFNYDKKNIKNYIGPSSFLEMGVAFSEGKKVFTINPIPQENHHDELVAINPVCLYGDLTKLSEDN